MSDTETHPTPTSPPTSTHPTLGRDGKPLPDNTKVDLDLAQRVMLEEYAGWYYPGIKVPLDVIVAELVTIGWTKARNDPNRPETFEQRLHRMGGES